MPGVWHRDHHCINIFAGHQLTIIFIAFTVLVAVGAVDLIDGSLEIVFVQITSGEDLAIFLPHECFGITRPLHAPSNGSEGDALRWGSITIPAQSTCRNDRGRNHGHARSS